MNNGKYQKFIQGVKISSLELGKSFVTKIKSFDYKAYQHLVKPSLIYFGCSCLIASATIEVVSLAEKQNISASIPTKSEVLDKPIIKVSKEIKIEKGSELYKEFWCLKILGWNEIRNGSEYAMKAVYSVVENRKNSGLYPRSYCGVMKQSSQFSFWNKGKYNVYGVEPKPSNPKEVEALKKIEEISLKVVTGKFDPVLPANILWYSTPLAKKNAGNQHWTNKLRVATQAGPHLFYSKDQT